MIHLTKKPCRRHGCTNLTRHSVVVRGALSVAYYGKYYHVCSEHSA